MADEDDMSRRRHTHLESGRTRDPYSYEDGPQPVPYCGPAGGGIMERYTTEPLQVTCPACRAKLGRARLRDYKASEDAAELALVKDETERGHARWGTYHRIMRNGQWIGFVSYTDKSWRLHALSAGPCKHHWTPGGRQRQGGGMTDVSDFIRKQIFDVERGHNLNLSSPQDITDTMTFSELGLDSLDRIEMVLATEEEFDIEIADNDLDDAQTVGDLLKVVQVKVNGAKYDTNS